MALISVANFRVKADFQPVLREILATHPGLKFLGRSPELQEIYGACVLNYLFTRN